METSTTSKKMFIGRKIERIRKLRGLTQEEVGNGLGISKQALSKLEQSEEIAEDRLNDIAQVLGVTLEGLKNFNEEAVLHNTNNFYESLSHTTVNNGYEFTTIINNPIEKIIELYETLLKTEREKVEFLRNQGKES